MEEIMNNIYSALLTVGVSIIGFFVKRCFDSLDKKADKEDCDKIAADVINIREDVEQLPDRDDIHAIITDMKDIKHEIEHKGDSADVQKLSEDIRSFRREYATKEELREIRSQMNEMKSSIDFLKEETVRKSDFVRVTTEISSKIDDLSSYLRGKL